MGMTPERKRGQERIKKEGWEERERGKRDEEIEEERGGEKE